MPRIDTLCPTSALLIDATSSVREFKTRSFGTDLANGRADSVDRDGNGFPAGVCDNLEGYLGDGNEASKSERRMGMDGNEEDLMGLLAGEMSKWSEGRLRVSIQLPGTVLKQPSLVVGAA